MGFCQGCNAILALTESLFYYMETEIWLPVVGYEDLYQVSSFGNVKSINYNRTWKEKILKKWNNRYVNVRLYKKWIYKNILVHRIVAIAFIKNPGNKETVNHKNWIRTDNRLVNLEWNTRSENQKHAYSIGLQKIKNN